MWARNLELALGLWLWISPFVFRLPPEPAGPWIRAYACGFAAILFPLLSYFRPLAKSHLALLAVAVWLGVQARIAGGSAPAPHEQNEILTGLLLAMLAVVPSRANEPPLLWRRWAEGSRLSTLGDRAGGGTQEGRQGTEEVSRKPRKGGIQEERRR